MLCKAWTVWLQGFQFIHTSLQRQLMDDHDGGGDGNDA